MKKLLFTNLILFVLVGNLFGQANDSKKTKEMPEKKNVVN